MKKFLSYSGIFFFLLAAVMLWRQLHSYSFSDILHAVFSIPGANLLAACIFCFLAYLALSLYDFLALRYVGKKISWWKWMLAGILGFTISNNAGNALVSGGAIRFRLYTRWRIGGGDIFKMIGFSGITYFLGFSAILVLGYLMVPSDVLNQSAGANFSITTLFLVSLSLLIVYFASTLLFRGKSFHLGRLDFRVPTTKMALSQMVIGIADGILSGLVLYFCITPFVQLNFWTFIGLFVVAQATGVFSQVPGGIGVFESIFLLVLPDTMDKADIFGALLTYRIIYYLLPLIGMGGLFFIYENYLRTRMKRWIAEAKEKIPVFPIKKSKNKKTC